MTKHGSSRIAATSLAAAGLLLGLAVMFATPAAAQPATINPEQACRDDAFKFCDAFIPNRDKVGACLRKNARKLTKDCRTVVFSDGPKHRTSRRHHTH